MSPSSAAISAARPDDDGLADRFRQIVSDEAHLRAALRAADTVPLLMVLVHLTGDEACLDEFSPFITGAWKHMEHIPDALKEKLYDRLVIALRELAAGTRALRQPDAAQIRRMMNACVGQAVPDEYAPLLDEETRFSPTDPRSVPWRQKPPAAVLENFHVAVIGAGLSGLCAGIKLREAGIPFTIIEKNDAVGGTWYENQYPGCGVDTPNHFYSYSFEPNADWSHYFSKRDEIWGYLEHCALKYDVRRNIHFETEVETVRFDDAAARWTLTLRNKDGSRETITANAVVAAVGQLNRPSIPPIPGLDSFKGPAFHTARWDHGVDLAGKRVAMIGTGASGMQVGPSIADKVEHLTIFQRSPHWASYNPTYHLSVSDGMKWVLKNIPYYANWYRFQLFWASSDGLYASLQVDPSWPQGDVSLNATNHQFRETLIDYIDREVGGDAELMTKVVPGYPPYGKRMLRDNYWFRTLTRGNVSLVTDHIDHLEPDGVVTRDGAKHPADMLVLATGFHAHRPLGPMRVYGREGRCLNDIWGEDDPRAYLGITVPGFPNYFIMYGPNTNLAHGGSAIFHTECQVRYTLLCLRELLETGKAALDVKQSAHDAYNRKVDERHSKMVWSHPGVTSWYKNKNGRVFATTPWRMLDYWRMTSKLEEQDYEFL